MRASKASLDAPDPELLAAYLDGEFEGRDGLEDLRRRLEAWLENDPAARDLVRDYRRLRQAWSATAPREPGRDVWNRLLARVKEDKRSTPHHGSRRRWNIAGFAGCAAAALLLVVGLQYLMPPGVDGPVSGPSVQIVEPQDEGSGQDDYELPVARAEEINILEGGDTATVVVRQPYQGTFELASAEDVTIDSMEPSGDDRVVPTVRFGARSPMVWAIAKTE